MGRIGAVILAAGNSSRLGQPKQLLEFSGETLVHSAARAAEGGGCKTICVVTGELHDAVARAVADLRPLLADNENWQRGIGSSIRAGVENLLDCDAVVLLACDQPAIKGEVVRALIRTYEKTQRPIVASRYANTLGIPALFSQELFGALLQLPDETGAKAIIAEDPARVAAIELPGGELDLDSPADLAAWRQRCSGPVRIAPTGQA